jgi:hypothetical protein
MASSTPIRRPLAALNSNNALSSQASRKLSHAAKIPSKPGYVEKTLLSITHEGEATSEAEQNGRLGEKKGHHSNDDNDIRANKRQRRMGPGAESAVQEHGQQQGWEVEGTLEKDEISGNHAKIGHELEENSVSQALKHFPLCRNFPSFKHFPLFKHFQLFKQLALLKNFPSLKLTLCS